MIPLREAFAHLLWPGLELAVWGADVGEIDVFDEERRAIARAVPSRQNEFLRGRSCLRACLDRLGAPRGPILPGPSREPQLPAGFLGSITHGAGIVAAVAAPTTWGSGVGLDVEQLGRMDPETVEAVLSPAERALARSSQHPETIEILTFSAKESVHKAVFPISQRWLEFSDVDVEFTAVTEIGSGLPYGAWGSFRPAPAPSLPARDAELIRHLTGRYLIADRLVITLCRLG